MVVSHLDLDHIRGVAPLMENWFDEGRSVGKLFLGLDRKDLGKEATALVNRALAWHKDNLLELRPPFTNPGESQLVASGKDWRIELVLPFYATTIDAKLSDGEANQCSVVLRITRADKIVYIGGNATLGAWEQLNNQSPIASHALRTPHHGGEIREGGSAWTKFEHLNDTSKLSVSVVSVGTNNRHNHPLPDHISAMARGDKCHVMCTQLTQQCHKRRSLDALRSGAIERASSFEYAYRHHAKPGDPKDPSHRSRNEVPCAGNVLIGIPAEGPLVFRPMRHNHRAFVDDLLTPLCR